MAATAMKKIGILVGCRNVVFAKMQTDTDTETTYDEENMFSAPGVIEIALTAQITNESIGADDVELYDVLTSTDGYEVSMTMAALGPDGKAFLLGSKQDAKGVLIEGSGDIAPYVAMGFKTARSDGSEDYVWLYKGKFAQGDNTFRTKEKGAVNWQTPVLTGTFMPRISDKAIRASVNDKDELASTIKETFFQTVYKSAGAGA